MNHNRSTALERSVKKKKKKKITGGLKPVLQAPNLALSFYHGSKHTVVRSAWRFSNSSMDHLIMKFTWFAVSFPTGKLKALLILFNNCFVYAHFSAFKWEIVNYFVLFYSLLLGYIFICCWKCKILWQKLLHFMKSVVKIMTKILSKSLLRPFTLVLFIAKVKVEILH